MSKTFGILLFPDAEELDFVGPYEVFGMYAQYFVKDWNVLTVAETHEPVRCAKGLTVVPDHSFEDCPELDVILVPGGLGTRKEVDNERLMAFVKETGARCEWVTSVCTGAFILHRGGFLDGRAATTHWGAMQELRELPNVRVVEQRWVQDGNVITAAGVSAGIDMTLYLVGQLSGSEVARNVQRAMEYYPAPPFADEVPVTVGKETA